MINLSGSVVLIFKFPQNKLQGIQSHHKSVPASSRCFLLRKASLTPAWIFPVGLMAAGLLKEMRQAHGRSSLLMTSAQLLHPHHTHTMRGKRHASLFRKNPSYSFCHSSVPPLPFCSSPLKILLGKALYGVDPAKLKFGTDSVHPCYWATFTNVLGLRERLYF